MKHVEGQLIGIAFAFIKALPIIVSMNGLIHLLISATLLLFKQSEPVIIRKPGKGKRNISNAAFTVISASLFSVRTVMG